MRVIFVHQEPAVEGLSDLDHDVLSRIHGEVIESNNFRVSRLPFFKEHFESEVLKREFETSLRALISCHCLEVPKHERIEQSFQITQLGFELCVDTVDWTPRLDQTFMAILNFRDDGIDPDVEILAEQVGVQPVEMLFLLRNLDARRAINLEEIGNSNASWGIDVRVAEVDVVREREFRSDPPGLYGVCGDLENAEPSPITVADVVSSSSGIFGNQPEPTHRPGQFRKVITRAFIAAVALAGTTAFVWLIDNGLDLALGDRLEKFVQEAFSGSEQLDVDPTSK